MSLFNQINIEKIKDLITKSNNISILVHKNVDADCMGAGLATWNFLNKLQKNTKLIVPNKIPSFFDWLNYDEKILIFENNKELTFEFIENTELFIILDFSDYRRVDEIGIFLQKTETPIIVIDHHQNPTIKTEFCFVDSFRSSASEIVFEFLKIINKNLIDKEIAEYLYAGIVSDTGSFKFDSVTSETLEIGAELLKYNIDKTKINNGLFNNMSENRLRFLGYLIEKKMTTLNDFKTAFFSITKEEMYKYNIQIGDTDGFVNIPLSIDNVIFVLIFVENENNVKVSLRSKGKFDVSKIASKYFDGGGHINASGGRFYNNLKNTLEFFEQNIEKIIEVGSNSTSQDF